MHIHLIGIGGSGLSAIARLLIESGYKVSGSDLHRSPLLDSLAGEGATVYLGHHPENIRSADLIVRSSAIPDDNAEVLAGDEHGIPVLKRSEFVHQLMGDRSGVAVAGTHGKTTTTAMIAWTLTALGQDPSFLVGSPLENLGANAHAGSGGTFVVEADEYDLMFLGLRPKVAVVTNIEYDHPDFFQNANDFYLAFRAFTERLTPDGVLIACADDPGSATLAEEARQAGHRILTFGLGPGADYRGEEIKVLSQGGQEFSVRRSQEVLGRCRLQLPGSHNVQNATAALAVIDQLGLPPDEGIAALSDFRGTARRFEVRGQAAGVTVIDDYAHHPTEIRSTLAAARGVYPERSIWALWQPHTYTRTHTFFQDFIASFKDADHVVVTEVYRAREPLDPAFSAWTLVEAMNHPDTHFASDLATAEQLLIDNINQGDVVIVLSAGDANSVCDRLLSRLKERSQQHVG